ncbi:hypothetical protein IVB56_22895 [Bradyrhizobium sp. CW7]|uniref:hypothetical protein n=1 Tax=Bradyrhizobium sp. CW7 TaxID=2782688 RepID=UPI001FF75502|nr:hypothetical protein [Bradyrhizobium sp. CW7]MCK1353842.1 hypothetical protein [Bradyrhizobium sp. CW7]
MNGAPYGKNLYYSADFLPKEGTNGDIRQVGDTLSDKPLLNAHRPGDYEPFGRLQMHDTTAIPPCSGRASSSVSDGASKAVRLAFPEETLTSARLPLCFRASDFDSASDLPFKQAFLDQTLGRTAFFALLLLPKLERGSNDRPK